MILLLLFGIYLWLARSGLTQAEARVLWTVRDDVPLNVAPRDTLRGLRTNVEQMVDRAEPLLLLPYYFVLDAWVTFTGESVLAARYFSALCILLAAALATRWQSMLVAGGIGALPAATVHVYAVGILVLCVIAARIRPLGVRKKDRIGLLRSAAAIVGVVIAVVIVGGRPDWADAIEDFNAIRTADEPSISGFAVDTPLAHYDRQPSTHFRQWITVDSGWRDFSPTEIEQIVGAMGGAAAIWLIDMADSRFETALAESGYHLQKSGEYFTRYAKDD